MSEQVSQSVSKYVSKSISRRRVANSHDALWLTNWKCFQFQLETREVHVLSYVRWQAVAHTRACRTEASITETVVRLWNEACPDGV